MSRRTGFLDRTLTVFLSTVERGGNALPHPGTLFALLAGLIVGISAFAARTGIEVMHPGTGELIKPVSLATVDGLHRILTEMVTNFTSFAPLGTVLVSMLGIGVMESSGLIGAALRLLVLSAPKRLLTFVIVLAGVLSNTASVEDKQIVRDASFEMRCVVRRPRYWAPLFALARSRIVP